MNAICLLSLDGMSTVIFSSDYSDIDPRQVLGPPSLHQNHVVLLQRVALARDKRRQLFPESHATALAIGRVRLLGFSDHDLQYDALHLRPAAHGPGLLGSLLDRTFPDDLVHCSQGCCRDVKRSWVRSSNVSRRDTLPSSPELVSHWSDRE